MKRRLLLILLCIALLPAAGCNSAQKFESVRYDLFDTEIKLIAYCKDQKTMDAMADVAFSRLEELHRLFDIYHAYEGLTNIYAVNRADGAEVGLNEDLLKLLTFGKEAYAATNGRVNIAMGAVLSLWHDARDTGVLPDDAALRKASQHCDISKLKLDAKNMRVTMTDPDMRLDVGAVAKGWAAGEAAKALNEAGYSDFILSAGGNIVASGTKNGEAWEVGVQDPDEPEGLCATVTVKDLSVVTSGGYQRFIEIGGKRYHHIIDPDTLYPGDYVLSATVICPDSAMADALSTACFLLPPEEAIQLAKINNARLILVDKTGKVIDTDKDAL